MAIYRSRHRKTAWQAVLLCTWILAVNAAQVYADSKIMPEELLEVAERKGCAPLADFYENRPGPVDPIYVYGYLPGDRWDSAVFWCRNQKSKSHPYSLIFVFKEEKHELTKCPDRIDWINPPRGLSVYSEKGTTLEGFVYLNGPKRKVPNDVRLTHNAIMSYYDGVEELFYCHKGEWLVRQSH
jgi:hypothetical protein